MKMRELMKNSQEKQKKTKRRKKLCNKTTSWQVCPEYLEKVKAIGFIFNMKNPEVAQMLIDFYLEKNPQIKEKVEKLLEVIQK